jgi:hypothetical protein
VDCPLTDFGLDLVAIQTVCADGQSFADFYRKNLLRTDNHITRLIAMEKKTETDENSVGHNPNHIPSGERTMNIIFSSILFLYGTFGVIIDDLYIPGNKRPGTHFHGEPAWILYGAFLCAVANMMSVVVDHYDKRNNETNYKLFARVTQIAGWTLFVLAFVLDLFVFHKRTK